MQGYPSKATVNMLLSVVAGLHRMNSSLSFWCSKGSNALPKKSAPTLDSVMYTTKFGPKPNSRRIMNICRHVRCATSRRQPPKWASDLMNFVKGEIPVPVNVELEAEPGSNALR